MWFNQNQIEMQGYLQQARTTIDSLKNTKLDSSAIESAKNAIATATEQIKTQTTQVWNPVWFGLITEKNVLFVALSASIMLIATMMYGWKKSILLIPIVLALCGLPLLL